MKKAFLIILLFLSLILVSGCTKKKGYTIKIVDFSDSLLDLNVSSETDVLLPNDFVDEKEPKHQIVSTNFGEIEAEYLCTTKNKYQYFYVREFRDMVGNEFWVNDTGIITLYFWFKSEKNLTNEIDEYKAIEIANNFIKKYDYLDFNDYKIKVDYKDWQEKFIVTYQKFINEVATADYAEVTVDLYGNIYCFSSQFLGMIPKDLELDFDFEKINNSIISRLDDIFSREKKNFDEVNYDLSNFELIMLDYNKYALVYNVKIDCVEIDKTNEDLKYHEGSLITFLVK